MPNLTRRLFKLLPHSTVLTALLVTGFERPAHAEEILLTGPLAGAPAVRKQRLYRKGRLEFAPQVSFTLLDEYQRLILLGARLNYNITDWLAIGGWGALSLDPLKQSTALTDEIQTVNTERQARSGQLGRPTKDHELTAVNMGNDFTEQLGTINWVASPQLTITPFRGKIAIFQSIYVDTDFYLFGGPAFINVEERAECSSGTACSSTGGGEIPGTIDFERETRSAIAPTFGIGFQFYINKWAAFGTEWRALPFARNTGGFDNRGGGPNDEFPDLKVDASDREFKFNQMISLSFGVSLPFDYQVSE